MKRLILMASSLLVSVSLIEAGQRSGIGAPQAGLHRTNNTPNSKNSTALLTTNKNTTQDAIKLTDKNKVSNKDFVVVLAVDGGGIRGIVPAVMIKKIEEEFAHPVTEIFDAFGGTSAGSIAISILNTKDPATQRPYTGVNLVAFIQEIGKKIFARPLKRTIRTVGGVAGSKYSAKPLEDFLKSKLGETKISDSIKDLTIVAYDFTNKKTFLFTTGSKKLHDHDYTLWETVRSSTAAPVLFKGHEMVIGGQRRTMIDGGIGGGMSPDLYLFNEVRKKYPGKKIFFVSLATGQDKNKSKIRGKGVFAGSIPGVLEQTIIQGLEAPIEQGKMILSQDPNVEYHRIDVYLPPECAYPVDNPSPKNLQCLQEVAEDFSKKGPFINMINRLKSVTSGSAFKGGEVKSHDDEFTNPHLSGSAVVPSTQKKKGILGRLRGKSTSVDSSAKSTDVSSEKKKSRLDFFKRKPKLTQEPVS